MKRLLFATAALNSTTVLAQPITQGGPGPYVDSPLTLDPANPAGSSGATSGSTGGTAGRQTVPSPQPQPNVIVVGPDGKVTTQAPEPAESGYYVAGGQQPYAEPTEIHAGPTPDLHVVRRGDTLWDISFYYFNDPWQWPKVWSYNPQITNPHWIYPGDLVRLLPRGMFVNAAPDPNAKAAPNDVAMRTTDTLPAPARRLEVGLKQTAFLEKKQLDDSITIVGSVDEKAMLSDGDSVYLSYPEGKPPQVGQRYTIYEPGSGVKQGDTPIGSFVRVLGTLEVVSVKQDKRARGVIISSTQEIERGAKVGPLLKTYKNVPPVAPKVDAQGSIVALLAREQLIGEGELVFVGLGKASGVEVGNRMYVVRRGDALPKKMSEQVGQDDRRFPARALGEIVVVEVGEKVSVGLVTLSVQEMSVGDLVMMQKQ